MMTTTTSKSALSRLRRPGSGPQVLSVVALLAVLAAVVCAVWFGYRAYDAYFVQKPIQVARDGAVDGAESAVLNVTTVDAKDTAGWRKRIESSLTGKARQQLTAQDFNQLNSMVSQAGNQAASLSSRLLRSAPIEINADENTGKVLVYVAATSKRDNEAGVTQTMGFSVSMVKEGDVWKAGDIAPLNDISYSDDQSAPAAGGGQTAPPAGGGQTAPPAAGGGGN
ncbi:hypothetical protein [Gordonia soli]|uniref:Uncharacterized protein n=1 Tax=Gordonia soli NBRC 108243 TaxID=1223545 RepID=M0QI00_9ACTN|nr:hypothetical protein [Gordonia soli]GAC67906.1 hypothetical protein GS4_11_01750 [Gordonia soli NBRC 108243]